MTSNYTGVITMQGNSRQTLTNNLLCVSQAQNERQENSHLREENVRLSSESTMMREALRQGLCINCGGCLAMGEWASEGNDLRAENAKLKGEVIT